METTRRRFASMRWRFASSSPCSIRCARATSSADFRSGTRPISLRYDRTGAGSPGRPASSGTSRLSSIVGRGFRPLLRATLCLPAFLSVLPMFSVLVTRTVPAACRAFGLPGVDAWRALVRGAGESGQPPVSPVLIEGAHPLQVTSLLGQFVLNAHGRFRIYSPGDQPLTLQFL